MALYQAKLTYIGEKGSIGPIQVSSIGIIIRVYMANPGYIKKMTYIGITRAFLALFGLYRLYEGEFYKE